MRFIDFSRVKRCCLSFFSASAMVLFAGAPAFASDGGIAVIPDASTLIQVVNFLFLIGALNFIMYKPIRKIIAQRKDKIEGFEQSIQSSEDGVAEKDEAYKAGVKEARAKGMTEKDSILQAAAEEEKKIIDNINSKAQENLKSVRGKIADDTVTAMESLQQEVDGFADAICEKILGRAA